MTLRLLLISLLCFLLCCLGFCARVSRDAESISSSDLGRTKRSERSDPFSEGINDGDTTRHRHHHKHSKHRHHHDDEAGDEPLNYSNNWGFHRTTPTTTQGPTGPPLQMEELLDDPNHRGALKDIGSIDVGFKVGVGVPGNDPVSVGARVGVGFGESGLAGRLPIGQNIFPRQGERYSLNDYDGDKRGILPGKASKYIQAVRDGRIMVPRYKPAKSLVGVTGGIGIGTPG